MTNNLIKLTKVRDYRKINCGKSFVFDVTKSKHIVVDTDNDNKINTIWFHDTKNKNNSVVSFFSALSPVFTSDIMRANYLDVRMVCDREAQFQEVK